VEVEFRDVDSQLVFGGSVSRYDNVSKVLRKLEKVGGVHFKVEGRRIIVTR
jgi:transmembrane sensor